MSTLRNNNTVKTSYMSVVTLIEDVPIIDQVDTSSSDPPRNDEYDSLDPINSLVAKDMLLRNKLKKLKNPTKPLPLPMKYFMTDMIEPLGDLTNDIKEVYELKGIANTLKLSDVLDAFESSLRVAYLGDIEVTDLSPSDEELVATSTLPK
jgi:hypothetical protein